MHLRWVLSSQTNEEACTTYDVKLTFDWNGEQLVFEGSVIISNTSFSSDVSHLVSQMYIQYIYIYIVDLVTQPLVGRTF